ncbi:MAG: hypothetical protein U0R52_03640 [Solirubrobacterales bacterium]
MAATAAFGDLSSSSEQKFIPRNVFGDVTASCSHGQHVNFGGFKLDYSLPLDFKLWPASMGPLGKDTNKWSTVAASPTIKGGKLTSIAYCQGGAEPTVVRKRKIVLESAANDAFQNVSVTCPKGRNVIGGGWAARTSNPLNFDPENSQNRLNIMGLQRTSSRTWQVTVVNQTTKSHAVTAIALCGKGAAPKTSVATERVPLYATKTATATCPGDSEVVFGGFRGDFDNLSGRNDFILSFYRSSKKAITVRGAQNGIPPNDKAGKLQAFAYCR